MPPENASNDPPGVPQSGSLAWASTAMSAHGGSLRAGLGMSGEELAKVLMGNRHKGGSQIPANIPSHSCWDGPPFNGITLQLYEAEKKAVDILCSVQLSRADPCS